MTGDSIGLQEISIPKGERLVGAKSSGDGKKIGFHYDIQFAMGKFVTRYELQ